MFDWSVYVCLLIASLEKYLLVFQLIIDYIMYI